MISAEQMWKGFNANQQRDIRTAIVVVSLAPLVKNALPGIVSRIKSLAANKLREVEARTEKNPADALIMASLKELSALPESLTGLIRLEELQKKVMSQPLVALELVAFLKKCFEVIPEELKFGGFGELITQNATSKFVGFIEHWHYSGKGFEPPRGMSEPFPGYDKIINALMGHSRCKNTLADQIAKYEKAQGK